MSKQELRCLRLAADYLGRLTGSAWREQDGPRPDDLAPNEKSPDAILIDDLGHSVAVEIKRTEGGQDQADYLKTWRTFRKGLVPQSGGHFSLTPNGLVSYPIDQKDLVAVKRQVKKLASTMAPGDVEYVKLQRSTGLSGEQNGLPFSVHCGAHICRWRIPATLAGNLSGNWILVDTDLPNHSFWTQEALDRAFEAIVSACRTKPPDRLAKVDWTEEWRLERYLDSTTSDEFDDGQSSVDFLAPSAAFDRRKADRDALLRVVQRGAAKFKRRPWADRRILVVEPMLTRMSYGDVKSAASSIAPQEFGKLHAVLFVAGDSIMPIWELPLEWWLFE